MFFNSLMEVSSVADIICITQITFKLINSASSANDGSFPLVAPVIEGWIMLSTG